MRARLARCLAAGSVALTCHACGGASPGDEQPYFKTLRYIQANGIPTLEDLMPALPESLSRAQGVKADNLGLPSLPSDLDASVLSASLTDFTGLVGEARELSAQGFSEARRVEALAHNLLRPVFNLLGKGDFFQAAGADVPSAALANGFQTLQQGSRTATLLDALMSDVEYAVALGESSGKLPSHLLFAAQAGERSIQISGLWPDASGSLATGFYSSLRLESGDDFELRFFVSPRLAKGLVGAWRANDCNEDLFEIHLKNDAEGRMASIKAHECPGSRDALTALTLKEDGDGYAISGSFAQTFASPKAGTLRAWLGSRQGFLLQAASPKSLDKVAAAAAVLRESEFADVSQAKVDTFGVGRLLADFVNETYAQPSLKKAKAASAFDLSRYEIPTYWLCLAPSIKDAVASAVPGIKPLCQGEAVDPEALLAGMQALNEQIKGVSLVPSEVRSGVKTLVDALTIRNSIFVAKDALSYKKAPDDAYDALDKKRANASLASLTDRAWRAEGEARMPARTLAELPDSPYKALQGKLGGYLRSECEALVTNAQDKAGKPKDAGGVCSF